MSPARYRAGDVARLTGLPTGKLTQHIDRHLIRLSENDVDADGSGTCRKFTAETVRKAALMRALTTGGLPPKVAGRLAEQFHIVQVDPNDLLVVTAAGGDARITREVRFGSVGQIVVGIGQLFTELQRKLQAA